MQKRRCVCGAEIPWKHSLCADCLRQYGRDRKDWPEWLLYLVREIQREVDYDRGHDDWEPREESANISRYPSEQPDPVGAAWRYIYEVMV